MVKIDKVVLGVVVLVVGGVVVERLKREPPPPPPPPPKPTVTFEQPSNEATVPWTFANSAQGGEVNLQLKVEGLSKGETILLTVTPEGNAERPQWGNSSRYQSLTTTWRPTVQVGNPEYPPQRNQRFEVKAYIVTTDQYAQHAKLDSDGHDEPPMLWDKPVSPAATCRFQLE